MLRAASEASTLSRIGAGSEKAGVQQNRMHAVANNRIRRFRIRISFGSLPVSQGVHMITGAAAGHQDRKWR
jgi:hypothetical protein